MKIQRRFSNWFRFPFARSSSEISILIVFTWLLWCDSDLLWCNSKSAEAQSTNAKIIQLTGRVIEGKLQSISQNAIEIQTSQSEEKILLSEIAEIDMAGGSQLEATAASIELFDGSQFRWVQWSGNRETLTGKPQLDSEDIRIEGGQVHWIKRNGIASEAWQTVIDKAGKDSDAVVVQKGESLDWVDAVIRSCSSTEVEFSFQGREVKVPIEKVAGLVFFHPPIESPTAKTSKLVDRYGQQWIVADWASDSEDQRIVIRTKGGLQRSLRWSDVDRWSFADLRFFSLSSRLPDQFTWRPLVPLLGGEAMASWNAPRLNQSVDGGRLQIMLSTENPQNPISANAAEDELLGWIMPVASQKKTSTWKEFNEGLSLRVGSEAIYQLNDSYQRLTGFVGLASPLSLNQNAKVTIKSDQQTILEVELDAKKQPGVQLDLPLSNPTRLTVLVEFGEAKSSCDSVNFGDLRLLK